MIQSLSSRPGCESTSATRKSISLALPAWNEADALPRAIAEAARSLAYLTSDYEIIVVDDGSTDETAVLTEHAAESNPHIRLLRHESNQGYGAALRIRSQISYPISRNALASGSRENRVLTHSG